MAETYKQYKIRYRGAEIEERLGRIPQMETRISTLENGGSDKHKVISFSVSTVISVKHDMGKRPAVTILDNDGNQVYADVNHIDANKLVITFGKSQSGKIILN